MLSNTQLFSQFQHIPEMARTKRTDCSSSAQRRSLRIRGHVVPDAKRKVASAREDVERKMQKQLDDDEELSAKRVVLRSRGRFHQQVENDVFEMNSRKSAAARRAALEVRGSVKVSEVEESEDDANDVFVDLASSEEEGELDRKNQKSAAAADKPAHRAQQECVQLDSSNEDSESEDDSRADGKTEREPDAREPVAVLNRQKIPGSSELLEDRDGEVEASKSKSAAAEPSKEERQQSARAYLEKKLAEQGPVKVSMRKWSGKLSAIVGTKRVRLAKDFAERNIKDRVLQMEDGVFQKRLESMNAFELMEVWRMYKGWQPYDFEFHCYVLGQSSAASIRKDMQMAWNGKDGGREQFKKFSGGKDWSEALYCSKSKTKAGESSKQSAKGADLSAVDVIGCKIIEFMMESGKVVESVAESASEACRRTAPERVERGSNQDLKCKADMQVMIDQYSAAGVTMSKIEEDATIMELCQMEMSGMIDSGEWRKDHALFVIIFNQHEVSKIGRVIEENGSVYMIGEDEHLLGTWNSWVEFKQDLAVGVRGDDSSISVIYTSMLIRNLFVVSCHGMDRAVCDIVRVSRAPADEALVLLRHTGRSSMGRFRMHNKESDAVSAQQFQVKVSGDKETDKGKPPENEKGALAKGSSRKRGRSLDLDASITGRNDQSANSVRKSAAVDAPVSKKISGAAENERVRKLLEELISAEGSCSRSGSQDARSKSRSVDIDKLEALDKTSKQQAALMKDGSKESVARGLGGGVSAVGRLRSSAKSEVPLQKVMYCLDDVQDSVFSASGELNQNLLASSAHRGELSVAVTEIGDVCNIRGLLEGFVHLPVAIASGCRLPDEDRVPLFNLAVLASHANRQDREQQISREGVVQVVSTSRKVKGNWGQWILTAGDGSGLAWFAPVAHSEVGSNPGDPNFLPPENMEYVTLQGANIGNVAAVGLHSKVFDSSNSSANRARMMKACVGEQIEYNEYTEGIVKRQSINTKKFMPAKFRFDSVSPTKAVVQQVVTPVVEAMAEKCVRYLSGLIEAGSLQKSLYPEDSPKLLVFNLYDPCGKVARTMEENDVNLPVGSGVDAISDRPMAIQEYVGDSPIYTMQTAYAQNFGVGINKTMQRVKAWQAMIVGYPPTALAQNKLFRLAEQLGRKLSCMLIFASKVAGEVVPRGFDVLGVVSLPGGCFHTIGGDFPVCDPLDMLICMRQDLVSVARSIEVKVSPLSANKAQARKFLQALGEEEAVQAGNKGATRKALLTQPEGDANEVWLKKPSFDPPRGASQVNSSKEGKGIGNWGSCDLPNEGGWGVRQSGERSQDALPNGKGDNKSVVELSSRALKAAEQIYSLQADIRQLEVDYVSLSKNAEFAREELQNYCDEHSGSMYGEDSAVMRSSLIDAVDQRDRELQENINLTANLEDTRRAYKVIVKSCIDQIDQNDSSAAARALVKEVRGSSIFVPGAGEDHPHPENQSQEQSQGLQGEGSCKQSQLGKEKGAYTAVVDTAVTAVGHESRYREVWMGSQDRGDEDRLHRTKRMRPASSSSDFLRSSSLRVSPQDRELEHPRDSLPKGYVPAHLRDKPLEDPFNDNPIHCVSEVAGPSFITPVKPTVGVSSLPAYPVIVSDLSFSFALSRNEGRVMVRFPDQMLELMLRVDVCTIDGVSPAFEGRAWVASVSVLAPSILLNTLDSVTKIGFMSGTLRSDGDAIEKLNRSCVGTAWLMRPEDCESDERIVLLTNFDAGLSVAGFESALPINRRRLCFIAYRTAKKLSRSTSI